MTNEELAIKITAAISIVLERSPHLLDVLMEGKLTPNPDTEIAGFNRKAIFYNPDYFKMISVDQVAAIIEHEAEHWRITWARA